MNNTAEWASHLGSYLKQKNVELDAVIDSAGGDILSLVGKYLKGGGKLVCYGM